MRERALELDRAHHLAQLGGEACARVRGSSSRATCMVMVEAPETMRPLRDNWQPRAAERERIDAVMAEKRLSS